MSMIDDIKRDREAGTPGPWVAPYETWDNGWSLDTDGENTAVGIGVDCEGEDKPIAITAVDRAFGKDHIVDANARRIARLPDLEAKYIALKEAADELAEAVSHERNMVCQDIGLQLDAASRVDTALARYREASQ